MAKTNYYFIYILATVACLCSDALGSKHIESGLRLSDFSLSNKQLTDSEIPLAIDILVRESRSLIGTKEVGNNRGYIIDAMNRLSGVPVSSPWCASAQYYIDHTSIICRTTVKSAYVPSWGNSRSPLIVVWDQRWKSKGKRPFIKAGCKFTVYFASMKREAHIGLVDEVSADSVDFYTGEGNTSTVATLGSPQDRNGTVYARKKRRVDSVRKILCPCELLTVTEKARFIPKKK